MRKIQNYCQISSIKKQIWEKQEVDICCLISIPLILFYFLKRKQNKKENHMWLIIYKRYVSKNQVWILGSGYLLKRYDDES